MNELHCFKWSSDRIILWDFDSFCKIKWTSIADSMIIELWQHFLWFYFWYHLLQCYLTFWLQNLPFFYYYGYVVFLFLCSFIVFFLQFLFGDINGQRLIWWQRLMKDDAVQGLHLQYWRFRFSANNRGNFMVVVSFTLFFIFYF